MRSMLLAAVCLTLLGVSLAQPPQSTPQVTISPRQPVDTVETQIQANAAAFVEAFNAEDTEALSRLFAEDAEYVDEAGEVTEGRDAIMGGFADGFAANPSTRIELIVDRVRSLGRDIAIEEGLSIVWRPENPPVRSRYTVLHVLRDGQWQIRRVQEGPAGAPSPGERLEKLSWMIGSWVDEREDSVISTECDWSEDGNFLVRRFEVRVAGSVVRSGVSRIGWDPLQRQFRSWVFESDGSFGTGLWTEVDSRWLVKMEATLADGTTASVTNILEQQTDSAFTFQSVDRVIGGQLVEDSEIIQIVRRAPTPGDGEQQ